MSCKAISRTRMAQYVPSLELSATKFLPSLGGYSWNSDTGKELSDTHKLDIRLARLDLKVIKRSSDPKAKFDLFQRLNSFGSIATAQEIRSAMVAGTNGDCLAWLTRLAAHDSFVSCIALNDRLLDEQYDIELVLRFLMLHNIAAERGRLSDFSSRLDDWAIELASTPDLWAALEATFDTTFTWLAQRGGSDVLRKWDAERNAFRGGFLNTSFEVFALGAGYHFSRDEGGEDRHQNRGTDAVDDPPDDDPVRYWSRHAGSPREDPPHREETDEGSSRGYHAVRRDLSWLSA